MAKKVFRIPSGTEFKAANGKVYQCVSDLGAKGVALDPQDGSLVIIVPHDAFFREVSYTLRSDIPCENSDKQTATMKKENKNEG